MISFSNFIKIAQESFKTGDLIRDLCSKLIKAYDENSDGEFDFNEFKKFSKFMRKSFPILSLTNDLKPLTIFSQDLKTDFDNIDTDKNGKITLSGTQNH